MSVREHPSDLERTLHEQFGLEQFRPGQQEVIEEVIRGRDVLCVMPTGGGKSLCYQLPALVLPGVTLVISPLIALMKDQVDSLLRRGIRATLLNSTLDPSEQLVRIHEIEDGQYDLVYIAPERFRSGRFVEMIARLKPALLAVDEAHCISQWGRDFRPDYARIGLARKRIGSPPCIALTATATDLVRRDIADQLNLADPAVFVAGFDRPNLHYAVIEARRDVDKLKGLSRVLDEAGGSAIIYTSSRARCEDVAAHIQRELRREAVVYHAGMTREQRTDAQERFMDGQAQVVVATNAFGMGVDKAEIRAVIHYNIPGTLEAYYQEAGRAGRDSLPARCVLLFAPGDRMLQERFIENEYPPPEVVYKVYEFLRGLDADPIELTQSEIKQEIHIDLGDGAVGSALRMLEGAGAIERFLPRENMAIVRINADATDIDSPPESLVGRLGARAQVSRIVLIGLEGLVNRRFNEPVYFQPDDLAAKLGIDRSALGRAIRSLCEDLPIDYVPPFRGNAIRVLDRSRRARDVDIDFSAMMKRKSMEYDKLDRMVQYAQTNRCRRSFLLGYFSDSEPQRNHCGHCDNCGVDDPDASSAEGVTIESETGRQVVLKVLSGVARAKGRFGKTIVAQMLKGSASEKVERSGLNKLSTFGILPNFTQAELSRILDALAEAKLLECPEVDRYRPVVILAERGWDYLKAQPETPLTLRLPEDLGEKIQRGGHATAAAVLAKPNGQSTNEESTSEETGAESDSLRDRLRELRKTWAREAKQPAYCVFNDATLESLVRDRPGSPHALAAVKGLGSARIDRYGAAILEAIAAYAGPVANVEEAPALFVDRHPFLGATGSPEPVPDEPTPAHTGSGEPVAPGPRPFDGRLVPTEEWTCRLLDQGFTIDEASAIRGIDRASVIRHLTLSARQGRAVSSRSFLDESTDEEWHGRDSQKPPPDADPELWTLFLACRASL
jgi:ATP-dependent DNA helicase RecQ